ncbi:MULTISPECIES: hypothetical protein [unclassified Halorhabdus]|uniref:DUF7313 family protein n=1 Tax=unclassified Halorhabdus TaxID=2621901 RepID=UPI0023DC7647|nr:MULTISPECIES: hypothetical protein [unclassified Halorhabdus]WEL17196.1 putative membrane protein [Halorhabdus sp. SVX81]WEL21078.1 putative membrane protein [Halorhabdus sp. BNX81]
MVSVSLFGPLDTLLGNNVVYLLLVLAVVNMVTRILAHRRHVSQAASGGADAVSRFLPHVVSNVLLILASFYYLTLHHHGGFVTTVLVLGLFLTDFFEFEARKAEARREVDLDRPKGAITASLLMLGYVGYQSLFFVVAPAWNAVI